MKNYYNYEIVLGKKFNKLTVIRFSHNNKYGNKCWVCKCDCQKETIVQTSYLKNGHTKSCGCLIKEKIDKNFKIHGLSKSSEYKTWSDIKNRCYNSNIKNYKYYGERGITMCNEWKDSFETFYKDMGPRPSKLHTIDRLNNNLGYFPGNCKWSTKKEQANNRRSNIIILHNRFIL